MTDTRRTLTRAGGVFAAVLLALSVNSLLAPGGVNAAHEPANKTSAAGSSLEIGAPNTTLTILSERVKTSKPTDLVLGVTLECAITTDVQTVGSDTQSAEGMVRVWVEIDGVPVPIAQDDTDAGRVVFCNRLYQRTTSLGTDDNEDSIRTFMRTRTANAFNWLALDVGSATHLVEVKAELSTSATQRASALAVIGNRTLVVEPTKAANDEVVTALS